MKKYIKPTVKLAHNIIKNEDGDLCIGELPGLAQIIESPPDWVLVALEKMDGRHTPARILKELRARGHTVDEDDLDSFIDMLDRYRLLEDGSLVSEILSTSEMERYDRQILQFSLFDGRRQPGFRYQEALRRSRAAILGLGGWGTWICLQLSLLGIGNLRIVDGDTVELSNLNRQVLYTKDDIGTSKVRAAKNRVQAINPHVSVEIYDEFVTRREERMAELLDKVDMIVLAWASLGYYRQDTVEELVHAYAEQNSIPLIELGGDPVDISVGPIYPYNHVNDLAYGRQSDSQKESYYSSDPKTRAFQLARMKQNFHNGNRTVNAWQSTPSLATMSGIVADQVVKMISGYDAPFLIGKRFHMSMVNFETRIEHIFDERAEG